MKKIVLILGLLCAGFLSFAQTSYTSDENALIQDVLSKRIELRKAGDLDSAIAMVDKSIDSVHATSSYKNAQREVKIVVDNLLGCAKYNCLFEKNQKDPMVKTVIMKRFDESDGFRNENKKANLNPWFYLSHSEVVNSSMQFLSRTKAISYGLQEKDDLDSVVKANPKMSFALISAGLWYYFAPGIGGGSKKKAANYFLQAVQNASNSYEKYYANLYYSQCCFDNKNYADSKKHLSNADSIFPGKRQIEYIKKLNDAGYSYFDYISDISKLEEKVK